MRRHPSRPPRSIVIDVTKPPDSDHPEGSLDVLHMDNGDRVVVHYLSLPDKDVTVVDGIPVTTPLRTVIDIAPDLTPEHLSRVVTDCLRRRLFTIDEAFVRVYEHDMIGRLGAQLLEAELRSRNG